MAKHDAERIRSLANKIEEYNNNIITIFDDINKKVTSITWKGQAGNKTKEVVDALIGNYKKKYNETMPAYVKYLREEAAPSWEESDVRSNKYADELNIKL